MLKYNLLNITTPHQKEFDTAFKNHILFFSKKYKIKINEYIRKSYKKKYTILRSPHVNKSARDQIEIISIEYIFLFEESILWNFFMLLFKKFKRLSIKYRYKKIKNQTLLL